MMITDHLDNFQFVCGGADKNLDLNQEPEGGPHPRMDNLMDNYWRYNGKGQYQRNILQHKNS